MTQSLARQTDIPPRAREVEILDSIRRTFAEKGFDGASMQELARAAGMSVGNFYRYFPSKAAMVEAIVTRDLAEVEQKFADVAAAPDPAAALRAGLHERIRLEVTCCDDAPLWAEISAAALRKPEIGAVMQRMEREICGYLSRAFALISGLPEPEAERRFGAHAAAAVMLVKSSGMQAQALGGVVNSELTDLVLRMIDMILDEVSAVKAKG
ncbi:TetR/AcrR family transcriptional regulator [Gemmobacter denitrificans]|uniref:Helix-turn-helix domain-containing protein n=1 Tax=Gemmobacter denitrificans TaxID=3123040 RepID=A0ABU8BWS1_9RHOB